MTKKAGVSFSQKKSDGNYGSIEASAWVEYEMDDAEDARAKQEAAHQVLKDDVQRRLNEALQEV